MNGAHGFGADFATTFSDIFDDLFGMGGRRGRGSGRERGADRQWRKDRHQAEGLSDVRGPKAKPGMRKVSSRSNAPARIARAAAR
jgi:hypothetical protein